MNIKLYEFCEDVLHNNKEVLTHLVASEWFNDNASYFYDLFDVGVPNDESDEAIARYLNNLNDGQKVKLIYEYCESCLNNNAQYDLGITLF